MLRIAHRVSFRRMSETTNRGIAEVRWPPRIRKADLRQLYRSIPSGRLNEEMLDNIGIAALLRCQAILIIQQARIGRVLCPVCNRTGREIWIEGVKQQADFRIRCPQCDWETTWADYSRTFKHKQLNQGGAGEGFTRYIEQYPRCRTGGSPELTAHFEAFKIRRDQTGNWHPKEPVGNAE